MSQCASGCTIRGHHLAECDGWAWGRDEYGEPEEVECAGCLPRQAEFGVLCSWCWGRLQASVRTLPSLVEHLFDMGAPSLRSPLGRAGGGRSTPGPGCLYSDALVAADELHAILGTWAQEVAVEHPTAGSLPVGLCRWSEGRPVAGPLDWADVADGVADPVDSKKNPLPGSETSAVSTSWTATSHAPPREPGISSATCAAIASSSTRFVAALTGGSPRPRSPRAPAWPTLDAVHDPLPRGNPARRGSGHSASAADPDGPRPIPL